jgi:hypothetical protein
MRCANVWRKWKTNDCGEEEAEAPGVMIEFCKWLLVPEAISS